MPTARLAAISALKSGRLAWSTGVGTGDDVEVAIAEVIDVGAIADVLGLIVAPPRLARYQPVCQGVQGQRI